MILFAIGMVIAVLIAILIVEANRIRENHRDKRIRAYVKDSSDRVARAQELIDAFDASVIDGVPFVLELKSDDVKSFDLNQALRREIAANKELYEGYLNKCAQYISDRKRLFIELKSLKVDNTAGEEPPNYRLECEIITEMGMNVKPLQYFCVRVANDRGDVKEQHYTYEDMRSLIL